jgi:hypothetical protein
MDIYLIHLVIHFHGKLWLFTSKGTILQLKSNLYYETAGEIQIVSLKHL